MQIQFKHNGNHYAADLARAVSIALPLDFEGPQLNHFGVEPAKSQPLLAGDFIGDTRQGGSCNVSHWSIVPHCNGTHTETVAHVAHSETELPTPAQLIGAELLATVLISVEPVAAETTAETYRPGLETGDQLITSEGLKKSWQAMTPSLDEFKPSAMVIRTLPSDGTPTIPATAFFTSEAIQWLNATSVEHLLADLASIDRANDEGRLSNHRLYWDLPPSGHAVKAPQFVSQKTITEMIRVPSTVTDGIYLLNLQVPEIRSDAVPSRPLLIPIS